MTDDPMPPTVNALPPKAQGLIARIQAILTKPAETWDVIAAEPSSIQSIYMGYVLPLAIIGPVATAIGLSVFGIGVPGLFTWHMPIMWSVVSAIVDFIMRLVMLYVLAFIIDMLAPSFDGQRNMLAAFKLAAYSLTAAWIVGIVGLIPMLGILGLAGLYSCYLFWVGLPKLMKSPPEKNVVYIIVIIVVAIVAAIIPAMISNTIKGMAGFGAMASGVHSGMFGSNGTVNGNFTIHGKDGTATVNLGQMAAAASAMEAQASAMQNSTAAPVKVADASALQGLMPSSYMGATISDTSSESGGVAGIQTSSATGHYTIGDGSITLKVADLGTVTGIGAMMNAAGVNASSSSGSSYGKITTEGNRVITEHYDSQAKSGEYSVVLNGRITVEGDGSGVDMNAIKGLVNSVDINKAMSLTQ